VGDGEDDHCGREDAVYDAEWKLMKHVSPADREVSGPALGRFLNLCNGPAEFLFQVDGGG